MLNHPSRFSRAAPVKNMPPLAKQSNISRCNSTNISAPSNWRMLADPKHKKQRSTVGSYRGLKPGSGIVDGNLLISVDEVYCCLTRWSYYGTRIRHWHILQSRCLAGGVKVNVGRTAFNRRAARGTSWRKVDGWRRTDIGKPRVRLKW